MSDDIDTVTDGTRVAWAQNNSLARWLTMARRVADASRGKPASEITVRDNLLANVVTHRNLVGLKPGDARRMSREWDPVKLKMSGYLLDVVDEAFRLAMDYGKPGTIASLINRGFLPSAVIASRCVRGTTSKADELALLKAVGLEGPDLDWAVRTGAYTGSLARLEAVHELGGQAHLSDVAAALYAYSKWCSDPHVGPEVEQAVLFAANEMGGLVGLTSRDIAEILQDDVPAHPLEAVDHLELDLQKVVAAKMAAPT